MFGTILFLLFFGVPILKLLALAFEVMSKGGVWIYVGIFILIIEIVVGIFALAFISQMLAGAMSV